MMRDGVFLPDDYEEELKPQINTAHFHAFLVCQEADMWQRIIIRIRKIPLPDRSPVASEHDDGMPSYERYRREEERYAQQLRDIRRAEHLAVLDRALRAATNWPRSWSVVRAHVFERDHHQCMVCLRPL